MRILITNDDGISAAGLAVLEQIAAEVAGPDGEVWTVAPAFEQSGVGHCISYTRPFMLSQLGERRFAAEGSPADCVLAGLHVVMKDNPPDLVLSGVNRGNNSAENVLYSGTLGGAMEAALQGIPAMGLSQYLGPRNANSDVPYEAAAHHGADLIQSILAASPENPSDYRLFYNINFPPVPAADVKGRRISRQGFRKGSHFSAQEQLSPNGRRYLWIRGGDQQVATEAGTDAANNLDGYISITPMRADLTATDAMDHLTGIE
ncbi:5'/3'-nucleotidase SurE [Phaeobacter sp.]|uniref:5'/3'-nucleotidase SurE n=1 Tax=Phaeobacter sp. TaxID=1902409 RepID=UPI0025CF2166|nr:5'/3'-nucleotidase SurE [Phaeobacter sp.]